MKITTESVRWAVNEGMIPSAEGERIEKLASLAVANQDALGLAPEVARQLVASSPSFGELSSSGKALFAVAFGELLRSASAALASAGGQGLAERAFAKANREIGDMIRLPEHGAHAPNPSRPDFDLAQHPALLLAQTRLLRVEGETLVMGFSPERLPEERSRWSVAQRDLTEANYLAAARQLLGPEFAGLRIEAREV